MERPEYKYFLYQHIRLDTNEIFYIGIGSITTEKTIKTLESTSHRAYYNRAYTKYGRSKFWHKIINKTEWKVEILISSNNLEFIKKEEIRFINLYGRRILKTGTLVNITDGGEGAFGYKHSEESRRKMSLNKKGRKLTKEHIEIIIKTQKGKKLSQETKNKISNAQKGEKGHWFGKKWPEERKRKLSLAIKGVNGRSILQYDLEGKFIREFKSRTEAKEILGLKGTSSINNYLSGRSKSAYGYLWKEKE